MDDKFRSYIDIIFNGVRISQTRRHELEDEIIDHLQMSKTEFIECGYTKEQAEDMAIEKFGKAEDIKANFKSTFTTYRRIKDIMGERKILKDLVECSISVLIALIICVSIRSYVFAGAQVKQSSMQNTLYENQRLIENKLEYKYSNPKRGDIVIINQKAEKGILNIFIANTKEVIQGFYKDQDDQTNRLVKRIIGIPGDNIDIREGKVYLNGNPYKESYVKGITLPNNMKFPIIVPKDHYFVMGDNREVSMDSRDLGFISIDNIEGKIVLRIWPIGKFGGI